MYIWISVHSSLLEVFEISSNKENNLISIYNVMHGATLLYNKNTTVPPAREGGGGGGGGVWCGGDTKALFIYFSIRVTYYILDSLSHIHTWQVSAQLNHGNIYEIWTWYLQGTATNDIVPTSIRSSAKVWL